MSRCGSRFLLRDEQRPNYSVDCNLAENEQLVALYSLYAESQCLEADDGSDSSGSKPTLVSGSRWCKFLDQLIAYVRMKTAVGGESYGCEPTQMEEGRHSRLRERLDQILVHGAPQTETLSSDDDDMPELTHPSKADDMYKLRIHELFAAVRFQVSPSEFAYSPANAKKKSKKSPGQSDEGK